jgi:hypothetical protein
MATTCGTRGWRGQKINAYCISALQGKLLPLNKEEDGRTRGHLFCFSLSSFSISPFYHKCNPSPLETIKGEAWATSKDDQHRNEGHTPPPKRPEIRSLS